MENETIQTATATEQTSEESAVVTTESDATLDTSAQVSEEAPATEGVVDEGGQESPVSPAPADLVFTPVYNGAVTPIKASDTDEVTTLLQLGMKQRAFLPVYEQLEQLAHESGAKSVAEFVKSAYEHNEKKHLDDAISLYGQEGGERFYAYDKAERGKAFSRYQQQAADAEQAAIQSRNAALAEQFLEMQAEYPEFAEFKDVPKDVIDLSIDKGIHLMDAMARFKRSEERKSAQAIATAQKATAAATGSMTDTADVGEDPLWAAFKRGADRHK